MRAKCCVIVAATFLLASSPYAQVNEQRNRAADVHAAAVGRAKYAIRDLGTLGGTESFAYAINARGDIVGLSRMPGDSQLHTFLYRKGTMIDLSPLDSQNILTSPMRINNSGQIACGVIRGGVHLPAIYESRTGNVTVLGSFGGVTSFGFNGVATAINNYGHAVGYSYLDGLNRHAFLYTGGAILDIGSLEGGYSLATDINDDGDVVGMSGASVAHAFLYRNGAMIEINPFGNSRNESYAHGINNAGEVVGGAFTANDSAINAFIYSDGLITNLGSLNGGQNSEAFAINDNRQVVGIADYQYVCGQTPTGQLVVCWTYRGFLYDHGVMIDLNSLIPPNSGWDLQWAFDINNKGQIVGYGLRHGHWRGYVLTPVSGRKFDS